MVIVVPERLSEGALVNAVGTATEAKTQALWEAGVMGTGTATDALCVLCPSDGPAHPYGGPRSTWGSRLARAVHVAVLSGVRPGAA
jgi:adenosylcobinamide amidohydrolase